VIEDAQQRRAALAAFEKWLASSAETASGLGSEMPDSAAPGAQNEAQERETRIIMKIGSPVPPPSGF